MCGVVPPMKANSSLCTSSSISLQTHAFHGWVGRMATIINTTSVVFVRINKAMTLCKDTVGVKHKLDDKKKLCYKRKKVRKLQNIKVIRLN